MKTKARFPLQEAGVRQGRTPFRKVMSCVMVPSKLVLHSMDCLGVQFLIMLYGIVASSAASSSFST